MKPATTFVSLSSVLLLSLLSPNARSAPETVFPDTVSPVDRPSDAPNWELGTIFRVELAGAITQVRVFSLTEELGDHQVRIWRNADNTLIAGPITWTFGGEEAWITLDIPDVSIQANQDYTVSVSVAADGWYPANAAYFGNAGNDGQFLSWPQGAGVFSDTAGTRPTNSFNNSAYLRDIVFEPDLSGAVMRVTGNGAAITDGAGTPSPANGTDVGGRGLNAGSRDQTFTISNIGQSELQLTGNPRVAITGAQAGDFVVAVQPAATVPGGGQTTFTIRFDPSAIGIRTASLSIPHGDSPTNPYNFAIQGAGLGGGAGVLGNDSEGTSWWLIGAAQIHGNGFQSPHDMRIAQLQAKVLELAGTFKCAVYSETNGFPDRLLRSSVEVVNATNGWNTFPLTSPLDLTAGDRYWLVIWSDTAEAKVQIDPVGTAYWATYSYLDLGGQWPDPISLTGGQLEKTYCIYAEGTPVGAVSGPAIDLRGNGKLIVSGDTTPSLLDGTDFGSFNVGSATPERTFTIENPGDTALELTNSPPVTVTGPQAGDFTVVAQPTSPIAPGGNASFTLRFAPAAAGARTATVTIENDSDTNPYDFAVAGTGTTVAAQLRITEIKPDVAAGSVTLKWDGDGPQFQVEKAAAVTGPFQAVGAVLTERVFTDAGVLQNATLAFYRIRQGSGLAPATCSTASPTVGFVSTPMTNQTGIFTVQFDAPPTVAPLDSVMALSSGVPTAYSGLACIARFSTTGNIDARNGSAYAADNVIPYSANVTYTFRLAVDIPAHTYTAKTPHRL